MQFDNDGVIYIISTYGIWLYRSIDDGLTFEPLYNQSLLSDKNNLGQDDKNPPALG
jgi:hypothetical protein